MLDKYLVLTYTNSIIITGVYAKQNLFGAKISLARTMNDMLFLYELNHSSQLFIDTGERAHVSNKATEQHYCPIM